MNLVRSISRVAWLLVLVLLAAGCRRDMFDQPRANTLGESDLFSDDAASRPLPPHTVARSKSDDDEAVRTGIAGTNLVSEFPISITREILDHGRERFEIHCAPCHGRTGEGNGIVVQRGFPAPPSYHIPRLREAPVGHFFDVMTRGYGVMYPQAARVSTQDRWAIAAYIRALQLSRNATVADLSPADRQKLERTSK